MVYAISSGCHRTVPIITADFYMRALENIVELSRSLATNFPFNTGILVCNILHYSCSAENEAEAGSWQY